MGWTEFRFEFLMERFPVDKSIRIRIFFHPVEDTGGPLSCSSGFHVREGPHNVCLVIGEATRTQMDVHLAGIKEIHTTGTVSVEFRRKGWMNGAFSRNRRNYWRRGY